MRRLLCIVLLVLFSFGAGCSGCTRRVVVIPNTEEGNKCKRECMLIRNNCKPQDKHDSSCARQEHDCLLSCPGAEEREEKIF